MVYQFRRLHNIRLNLNTKLAHFIETIVICIYFCSCSKHDKKLIWFHFAVIASRFLLREHSFAIFTSRFFLRGYYFAVFVSRFLLRGYCLRGYCFRDYHLEALYLWVIDITFLKIISYDNSNNKLIIIYVFGAFFTFYFGEFFLHYWITFELGPTFQTQYRSLKLESLLYSKLLWKILLDSRSRSL
jgi:hypothetical protein